MKNIFVGNLSFTATEDGVRSMFEAYDPQLGDGYTAQVNEDGRRFKSNALFDDVSGNVLIGRTHGAEMWGLSVEQRAEVLTLLKTKR